jgi:uncharacterized protein YjiS (DUF1127 family)
MDRMTDTTLTFGPQRGFARRLRLWLAFRRRRRTTAVQLDELSDRMLRDIGVRRDEIGGLATRTQHDAMRYSG